MATVHDSHALLLQTGPLQAEALNEALAAGFDINKLLALMAKWGPKGIVLLKDAITLWNNFSWPAFWLFLQNNGPDAFAFLRDFIAVFGQPKPAADHVGALPTV